MEGHLLAPMLEEHPPAFPLRGVVGVGGHTQLVHVGGIGEYRLLGNRWMTRRAKPLIKPRKCLAGLSGRTLAALAEQGEARFAFPGP